MAQTKSKKVSQKTSDSLEDSVITSIDLENSTLETTYEN
jgi:hypothetical protein